MDPSPLTDGFYCVRCERPAVDRQIRVERRVDRNGDVADEHVLWFHCHACGWIRSEEPVSS